MDLEDWLKQHFPWAFRRQRTLNAQYIGIRNVKTLLFNNSGENKLVEFQQIYQELIPAGQTHTWALTLTRLHRNCSKDFRRLILLFEQRVIGSDNNFLDYLIRITFDWFHYIQEARPLTRTCQQPENDIDQCKREHAANKSNWGKTPSQLLLFDSFQDLQMKMKPGVLLPAQCYLHQSIDLSHGHQNACTSQGWLRRDLSRSTLVH